MLNLRGPFWGRNYTQNWSARTLPTQLPLACSTRQQHTSISTSGTQAILADCQKPPEAKQTSFGGHKQQQTSSCSAQRLPRPARTNKIRAKKPKRQQKPPKTCKPQVAKWAWSNDMAADCDTWGRAFGKPQDKSRLTKTPSMAPKLRTTMVPKTGTTF